MLSTRKQYRDAHNGGELGKRDEVRESNAEIGNARVWGEAVVGGGVAMFEQEVVYWVAMV